MVLYVNNISHDHNVKWDSHTLSTLYVNGQIWRSDLLIWFLSSEIREISLQKVWTTPEETKAIPGIWKMQLRHQIQWLLLLCALMSKYMFSVSISGWSPRWDTDMDEMVSGSWPPVTERGSQSNLSSAPACGQAGPRCYGTILSLFESLDSK